MSPDIHSVSGTIFQETIQITTKIATAESLILRNNKEGTATTKTQIKTEQNTQNIEGNQIKNPYIGQCTKNMAYI